jgi:hypothetical protein
MSHGVFKLFELPKVFLPGLWVAILFTPVDIEAVKENLFFD